MTSLLTSLHTTTNKAKVTQTQFILLGAAPQGSADSALTFHFRTRMRGPSRPRRHAHLLKALAVGSASNKATQSVESRWSSSEMWLRARYEYLIQVAFEWLWRALPPFGSRKRTRLPRFPKPQRISASCALVNSSLTRRVLLSIQRPSRGNIWLSGFAMLRS